MAKETGWAIAGNHGLYTGWSLTKCGAIAQHVSDCWSGRDGFDEISPFASSGHLERDQALAWKRSRKSGDRAVRVTLSYT